ncbi:MAG: thioredoxin domain-containing protein [Flavobacteriales bacterium]|nr:thioredoxin domain-containing protein [Flavobacteriales bacterium]
MNLLSVESSPYLLQHKDNPVHWRAWNAQTWQVARQENKMVLVSIGYSACHWCHVMEHEVFEDEECAAIMNRHFVCIKVDREERPDVDMLYMDAVHLMGQRGGWPLNVFTLPDGRPIYGGTYFPKKQWISVLENLIALERDEPGKMKNYAERLQAGLREVAAGERSEAGAGEPAMAHIRALVGHWKQWWDLEAGGSKGAPKFPMPVNWKFLLSYAAMFEDPLASTMAYNTLDHMAAGGIFDHVGGGWARYSVDDRWHIPHFEKMLYDNAQLIELYSLAFRKKPDMRYRKAVALSMQWLDREMKSPEGLYYAAVDADSEGEEGKYYVWSEEELKTFLDEYEMQLMRHHFRIGNEAFWEHGNNVLVNRVEAVAGDDPVKEEEIEALRQKLLIRRNMRTRPGTDVKCITSWNAMLVKAMVLASETFDRDAWLRQAEALAESMLKHLKDGEGRLCHVRTSGKTHTPAFLDDYAQLCDALLCLHEHTTAEKWLTEAQSLTAIAMDRFGDDESPLFWFTDNDDIWLLQRKKEIQDNVTPASNSVMCGVLYRLGRHLPASGFGDRALAMLRAVIPLMDHASAYAGWLWVYLRMVRPGPEVIITGPEANEWRQAVQPMLPEGTLLMASTKPRSLPLFEHRFGQSTSAYVCTGRSCLPVAHSLEELSDLLKT